MTVTRSFIARTQDKKKVRVIITTSLTMKSKNDKDKPSAMKTVLMMLCMLMATVTSYPQISITQTDPALIGAIVENKEAINSSIRKHNNLQSAILATDEFINMTLDSIHRYERIVYDYLSEAQSAVQGAMDIKYCAELTVSIMENTESLMKAVANHPEGAVVTAVTESPFLKGVTTEAIGLGAQVADLVTGGGSKNLLNSYERTKILSDIRWRLFSLNNRIWQITRWVEWKRLAYMVPWTLGNDYYTIIGAENKFNETVRGIKNLFGD